MYRLNRRGFLKSCGAVAGASALGGLPLRAGLAANGPEFMTLVGGGQGGAWYLGAATMAEMAKDLWPDISTTVSPGGGIANLQAVGKQEIDIGYAFAMDAASAYQGTNAFEGRQIENLRALFSTNGAYLSTVAKPEIKSYRDLAGKSAAPGRAGMTGLATFRNVVRELGIEDEVDEINTDYPEMPTMFQDGVVQAATVIGSIPHQTINEILLNSDGHLLEVEDEVIEALSEKYNYERVIIPAGTFEGQDEDVVTIGSVTQVTTYAELDEEWVYQLVKSVWEGRDKMVQAHVSYKEMDEDMVTNGVRIPFHPGAERYWKEVGLL